MSKKDTDEKAREDDRKRPEILDVASDARPWDGAAMPNVLPLPIGKTGQAPGGDRLAPVRNPQSLFRQLFDEPDPRRALQEAARIFAGLAGGSIKLEIAATTRHAARVRVFGSAGGRNLCLTAMGFFRKAVELSSGERTTAAEVRCTSWGDDCCEFSFHYQPRRNA